MNSIDDVAMSIMIVENGLQGDETYRRNYI